MGTSLTKGVPDDRRCSRVAIVDLQIEVRTEAQPGQLQMWRRLWDTLLNDEMIDEGAEELGHQSPKRRSDDVSES